MGSICKRKIKPIHVHCVIKKKKKKQAVQIVYAGLNKIIIKRDLLTTNS